MVATKSRSRKPAAKATQRKSAIARSSSTNGRRTLSRRTSVRNFGKAVINQKVIPDSEQEEDDDDIEVDKESVASLEDSEDDFPGDLDDDDGDEEEDEDKEKNIISLATARALGQVAKKRRINDLEEATVTPKSLKTPVSKVIKSHSRFTSTRNSSARSSKASSENGFDGLGLEDTPATSVSSGGALSPAWNGKLRPRRSLAPLSTGKSISKIKIEDSEGEEDDEEEEDQIASADNDDASVFSSGLSSAMSDASAIYSEAASADEDDDSEDGSDAPAPARRAAAPKSKRPVSAGSARRLEQLRRDRRFRGMTNRAIREKHELWEQHPYLKTIWEELDKYEKIPVEKIKQPSGLNLKMLSFQLEGVNWLYKQERTKFNGGILADEMGMGKTIQTIGLLMMEPREKPNLVVAPTVALMQWRSEIERFTDGGLSVFVFHGKERLTPAELKKHDVVLTTYNQLESVFRKQEWGFKRKEGTVKEKSALHSVPWHRVILDEAHNVKDRQCNTAKAVFHLKTKFKLCLSGTPLQNRIGELFSLLRFLETDPFSYYFCRKCKCKSMHWKFSDYKSCDSCKHRPMDHVCWFNNELLKPIQRHGNELQGRDAFTNLQKLLSCIMLRRTKIERADDLGLPPRIVRIRRDKFNPEELEFYDSLYGDSKRTFNSFVAAGVVLNNYANIFTLITRMRQVADHPDLVLRRKSTANDEASPNNLVCVLCDEEAEEAIKSKCHHLFCRLCVQKYIDAYDGSGDPDCPTCHIPLVIDLSQPSIEVDTEVHKRGSILNRININEWRSSTKIEALCEELYRLRSRNHTIKSIVFSQFTSMLQLVEWRLKKAGFKTVMLEGSMSPAQREKTIEFFMNNVSVEVFLVSLKAGGVALNLTEASQVFILDPWWNPSVEWQSGDRIHRIGQTRPCRITRLVIENSIESRIVELQEKKANMINATVGNDQAALEKLSPADLQFLFQ